MNQKKAKTLRYFAKLALETKNEYQSAIYRKHYKSLKKAYLAVPKTKRAEFIRLLLSRTILSSSDSKQFLSSV